MTRHYRERVRVIRYVGCQRPSCLMATEPGRVLAAEGYRRRRRKCLVAGQPDGFFFGLGSVKIIAGSDSDLYVRVRDARATHWNGRYGCHIRCGS